MAALRSEIFCLLDFGALNIFTNCYCYCTWHLVGAQVGNHTFKQQIYVFNQCLC